ncbi:MAG: hypothetical protein GY876_02890, partial [Planctomycetes bacterium]|nr:hypothetical protein [Planctomycetota bacterium]
MQHALAEHLQASNVVDPSITPSHIPAWSTTSICQGALKDYGISGDERLPVLIPLFAVHICAESDHSVDTSDSPPCSCLLESSANHVFAGPFDLTAADRPAL